MGKIQKTQFQNVISLQEHKNTAGINKRMNKRASIVTPAKKNIEKKKKPGNLKSKHQVLALFCSNCKRKTKLSIFVPQGQEVPSGPFDFCCFCIDCNSFTSLILAT